MSGHDRGQPPVERLSLRVNIVVLTAGRVLAAAAQWGALIVVAKASDVETTGQFALAQVICVPIAEIARMGLREVRATDVSHEYPFSAYFGLRLVISLVAYAAMVVIGAVAADSPSVLLVIALYAASRVVELLADIVYGLFQLQERLDYIGRSLALVAPLSILFLTAGFLATDSLAMAVAGQLLAYVVVFVFHDLRVARRRIRLEPDTRLLPSFDRAVAARLFRIAIPLGAAAVFGIVAVEAPRVVVAARLGTEPLGVFVPLFALGMAPSRFVHSLGTAATTPLAALHQAGDRRGFERLLSLLALVAAAFGAVGVLAVAVGSDTILRVVYTPDYEAYGDLFLLLVVAGALRFEAVLLQYGLIARRQFWFITTVTAAVSVVAVVAAVVLAPRGLEEAGLAVVIAFTVHLAVVIGALFRGRTVAKVPAAVTS